MSNNSVGGNLTDAGAGAFGGHIQTAPAQFQVDRKAFGFGPMWTAEDLMAASIIRLEQENQELRAEVALLREQARILTEERDEARKQLRVAVGLLSTTPRFQDKHPEEVLKFVEEAAK